MCSFFLSFSRSFLSFTCVYNCHPLVLVAWLLCSTHQVFYWCDFSRNKQHNVFIVTLNICNFPLLGRVQCGILVYIWLIQKSCRMITIQERILHKNPISFQEYSWLLDSFSNDRDNSGLRGYFTKFLNHVIGLYLISFLNNVIWLFSFKCVFFINIIVGCWSSHGKIWCFETPMMIVATTTTLSTWVGSLYISLRILLLENTTRDIVVVKIQTLKYKYLCIFLPLKLLKSSERITYSYCKILIASESNQSFAHYLQLFIQMIVLIFECIDNTND